ncbi:hypothetical protein [Kribbella sindirgiensis]|uniref:Uncharacterized protein n=1 Tax=Kribbella sindirgiensis TaxID=1124744 RepID=A0A4R0I543_9ACTN|nr:hypothetical protein [Kribbella sindirgiensis]TCC19983.1 hypothetical protein E0H50_37815 [Kribbella sindirgiensis]
MTEHHVDWQALEVEGVDNVIVQAARSISKNERYRHAVEIEDLQQDARILVATKPDLQECVYEGSLGLLHHRLVHDLKDQYKTEARRKDKTQSFDELWERVGGVE